MPHNRLFYRYLSTVILPEALTSMLGYSTDMNLNEILNRIERRLKVVGLSADKACKLAGTPDAIRNMRRAVKGQNARSGITNTTIEALAPILKTTAAWLLYGQGPEEQVDPVEPPPLSPTLSGAIARLRLMSTEVQNMAAAGILKLLDRLNAAAGSQAGAPGTPDTSRKTETDEGLLAQQFLEAALSSRPAEYRKAAASKLGKSEGRKSHSGPDPHNAPQKK